MNPVENIINLLEILLCLSGKYFIPMTSPTILSTSSFKPDFEVFTFQIKFYNKHVLACMSSRIDYSDKNY